MPTDKNKEAKGNSTALVKTQPAGMPATQASKTESLQRVNVHEAQVISVEETIRRVAALSEHIHTRRVLFTHLDKLEALKFGEFDEKDCLILQTAAGQSYTIKSPTLCKKLTEVAKSEISDKIDEIEAQLVF